MVSFEVIRCPEIERDIKALRKKYRHAEDDLRGAERLLEKGIQIPYTVSYPGFGTRKVNKTRVVNRDLGNEGSRSGYRILYEIVDKEDSVTYYIIIYIYCKKGSPDERDIRREANKRMGSDSYPMVAS